MSAFFLNERSPISDSFDTGFNKCLLYRSFLSSKPLKIKSLSQPCTVLWSLPIFLLSWLRTDSNAAPRPDWLPHWTVFPITSLAHLPTCKKAFVSTFAKSTHSYKSSSGGWKQLQAELGVGGAGAPKSSPGTALPAMTWAGNKPTVWTWRCPTVRRKCRSHAWSPASHTP